MATSTKIEWTDESWNPIVGCSKVSAGCKNCYAERRSGRLAQIESTAGLYGPVVTKGANGQWRFNGTINKATRETLLKPLSWRKPRMVFVNSMSDLFHENVPTEWIDEVFAVMAACPQHTFQILTKRPERMKAYLNAYTKEGVTRDEVIQDKMIDFEIGSAPFRWPLPNVWLGTSVEDQAAANERIPHLLETPAAVRFLSCEPLIGDVNLRCKGVRLPDGNLTGCDSQGGKLTDCPHCEGTDSYLKGIAWLICGGESGPNARPMHPDWARSLRDQCVESGTAFFFKQWGDWLPRLQGWERKSEAEFEIELELWAQKKTPAPSQWRAKRPDLNSENKEWGCLTRSGEFYPETTTWNSRQESPEDNYETTVIRVGKKAAGRELDGREWNEYPDQKGGAK